MIINQPFGIGDIIYLEPLFRRYLNMNWKKPILPVRDHLMNLAPYFESVEMVPLSSMAAEIFDMDDAVMRDDYLPLRFANQILRGFDKFDHHDMENHMPDKYRLVGMNEQLWRNIDLKFDLEKAKKLYDVVTEGYKYYNVINDMSGVGKVDIQVKNGNHTVVMRPIHGFTVIDWFLVIFHAQENHHVSTSTFHLMQAIANKFPEFKDMAKFIYPRPNEDGLRGISNLQPTFTYKAML